MPGSRGVIRLELARAADMFETPHLELGAEFGGSIPGIDRCIAELAGHPTRPPIRVDVVVPAAELTPGVEARLGTSLRRYCDEHRRYNDSERRAIQRSGLRALRIGLPVSLLGLIIVGVAAGLRGSDESLHAIVDIVGWVFAWLGLWYPFDKVLFYPLDLVRENHALAALHDATVTVTARASAPSRAIG